MRWAAAALAAVIATGAAHGQELQPVVVDRLPTSLAGDWLFRTGHDPGWASPFRERRNWFRLPVPGAWERHGYPGYDGHAWYRLPIFVSTQLAGQELGIDLGMIGDSDEVFLNGRRVGGTGSPPPRLDRAPLARRFYPLPREAIRFGEHNELAVHVFNAARFGGLLGPAPRIDRWDRLLRYQVLRDLLAFSLATLLGTLALFHLSLFVAQRDIYEHLSYAAFLVAGAVYVLTYTTWGPASVLGNSPTFRLNVVALLAAVALFPPAPYRIASQPLPIPVFAVQTLMALGAVFAIVWREETDLYFWIYTAEAAIVALAGAMFGVLLGLVRQRHAWGKALLTSTVVLICAIAIDILVDAGVLRRSGVGVGELFTPLALVPFAVVFSLALSYSWVERRWGEPLDLATGLISRDRFLARLGEELMRSRRSSAPAVVALLRVEIPDRSRNRDDLRLAAVEVLRRTLRQVDLLARFDRETLAILLADTEERGAIATLERLRRAVTERIQSDQTHPRTSAGVVQYRPGRHTGPDEVIAEAEAALYAALAEGGDRTTTTP